MHIFSTRLWKKSLPLAALLLLTVAFLAAPAVAQAPTPTEAAEADEAADTSADANAEIKAGVWWNRTRFIDRLALSEEQRLQMDALLDGHLEKADRTARAEQQKTLGEALAAGEWDKARSTADALNATRAEAFTLQTELKISVLQLLEANQRQALSENFPRLVDRPWVRAGRGGAKDRDRQRRRGARR